MPDVVRQAAMRAAVVVWLGRVILALAGLGASGCAGVHQRSALTSSTDLPAHALAYPDMAAATLARMRDDEVAARAHLEAFGRYPSELRGVDQGVAVAIIQLADREGRSQAFVAALDQARSVRRFLQAHERQLGGRIAFAIKHATADKGCTEDVGSLSVVAVRRTLTRQLTDSLREHNAAQHAISEYEGVLGKGNARRLRAQVDAISMTSFIAHVAMDDHRRELERLLAERQNTAATLDRVGNDLQAVIDDPAQPQAARRLAQQRLAGVKASQLRMAELAPALQHAEEHSEARAQALRNDYQMQLDSLLATLEAH